MQSHIYSGIALFALFSLPFFTRKGGAWHVFYGRLFVLAWLVHLVDGLVNSVIILITRGFDANNYPTDGFSMYLYVQFAFVGSCIVSAHHCPPLLPAHARTLTLTGALLCRLIF